MYSWRYNILLEVNEGILPSVKGGYSDFFFLHLTELENILITEIHMKKRYKSLIITSHANFGLLQFSSKYRYDVENTDKWAYNFLIE